MSDYPVNTFPSENDGRFSGFGHLMPHRVQEVLLVASMYDAFTLEEGGRLTEMLLSEYRELNLSFPPHVTRASTGEEALKLMDSRRFDLVITMTRLGDMMASELAGDGITVNSLAPSAVMTERIEKLRDEAEREATAATIPLGRYQSPEEVASWVLFLASAEAGFMTGQTVSVNGGRFMT